MDIEQEILNKVSKWLLIGALMVAVAGTATYIGMKQWFWHQVDQEVALEIEKLDHTSFGDIVSRSEVRFIRVGFWTAKIDIVAEHLSDNSSSVYINVSARGEDTAAHSYHAHVTTTDGINTIWSNWVTVNQSGIN